jgi:hypothetical protein
MQRGAPAGSQLAAQDACDQRRAQLIQLGLGVSRDGRCLRLLSLSRQAPRL